MIGQGQIAKRIHGPAHVQMGILFANQFFCGENKRPGFGGNHSKGTLLGRHRGVVHRGLPDRRLGGPDLPLIESGQQVHVNGGSGKQISHRLRDDAGAGKDFASFQQLGRKCGEINRQNRTLGYHGFGPEVT